MPASNQKPWRTLIILENLPVPFSRRVWSVATTLQRNGYEVSVMCPKGPGAEKGYEVIDGVHIYRHPLPLEAHGAVGYLLEYSSALFWEFLLAWRIFFARGFDVIHATNPPDLLFIIGGFFKIFFGKKFIFDHHDINPELYESKFGKRGFFWRLLVFFERTTYRTADVSIATNESYRKIAIERGKMDPDRVFIVRSGPNLAKVKQMPPDDKWKSGRKYLAAYVGVIGQQEGIDLLLDTVDYMIETRGRRDVQFVVMGSGPALEPMRALAAQRKLTDYVTFTGRVSDEDLFTVLSTADICVNPDKPGAMNDKSTMNKIMEYMAFSKAIVQYDLTEGRFSAQHASLYASDYKDFGDKVIELLDDPKRREEMGAFGRKRVVENLSWEHEAPKLLAAYELLFAKAELRRAAKSVG